MTETTQPKLRGIMPPLVTPIDVNGKFDEAAMERLVTHVTSARVNGLFLLGTTGEGPSLDYRTRSEVVKRTIECHSQRVPVLVSVTDTSLVEMERFADEAAQAGAKAFVVAPPYYLSPGAPEILNWIDEVDRRLCLPYFIYNMPGMTKVSLGLGAVSHLLEMPSCLGFKDSSLDLIYLKKVLALTKSRDDFSVFIGPEEMLVDALAAGADGGVSGGANVFPQLYVGIFEAFVAGNFQQAWELQEIVCEFSSSVYGLETYGPSVIKGIKASLAMLDICTRNMAAPFDGVSSGNDVHVRTAVERVQKYMASSGLG